MPLIFLWTLLTACEGGTESTEDSDITEEGLRTLDNCETSFGDDVPAFFQTYFRCVSVTIDGPNVLLHSQGLPPHKSSYYPEDDANWEAWDDRGGEYHQNPNTLQVQALNVTIPMEPVEKGILITEQIVDLEAANNPDEYHKQGLSLDGTAFFFGTAAPGHDIREEEYSFDPWAGHPQQSGIYHHHGAAPGPLMVLEAAGLTTNHQPGSAEVELYGMMCDGTLVFGCTELDGSIPDGEGLDAQGGHLGDIVASDGTVHFSNRYHTHVCIGQFGHEFTPEIQYYDHCD